VSYRSPQVYRKPVPSSKSTSSNDGVDIFQIYGPPPGDRGCKHRKWQSVRTSPGNLTHVHPHQSPWPSLGGKYSDVGDEEGHHTSQHATHMEPASAREPNLGKSSDAFSSGLAHPQRIGGERPCVLEDQRNDCGRAGDRMVDAESESKGELHGFPVQCNGKNPRKKKNRVQFADEDRIVGWANEKNIEVPDNGENAKYRFQMDTRNDPLGGFDGASDCEKWIVGDRRPALISPLRRGVASSDRLVEVHPEPVHVVLSSCVEEDSEMDMDALIQKEAEVNRAEEKIAYREKKAAVKQKFAFIHERELVLQAETAHIPEQNMRIPESEAKTKSRVYGKRVSMWHSNYNSAAWRVAKEKKNERTANDRVHKHRHKRLENKIGNTKAVKGPVFSHAVVIEVFGYGVAVAILFTFVGWLASGIGMARVVHS
jgi:hypothetical protein